MNDLVKQKDNSAQKEILESLPIIGPVINICQKLYEQKKVENLAAFLEAAKMDEDYLKKLANDEDSQKLLIEYIKVSNNTTSKIVSVALALIYKDSLLEGRDSFKSVCASSLNGISYGSLNMFMTAMKKLREFNSDVNRITPQDQIQLTLLNLGKDPLELETLAYDLDKRNMAKINRDFSYSTEIKTNEYSEMLFRHLEKAQEWLDKQ